MYDKLCDCGFFTSSASLEQTKMQYDKHNAPGYLNDYSQHEARIFDYQLAKIEVMVPLLREEL